MGKMEQNTWNVKTSFNTRTVLRVTLIRNYNDQENMIPAFAKMFRIKSTLCGNKIVHAHRTFYQQIRALKYVRDGRSKKIQ